MNDNVQHKIRKSFLLFSTFCTLLAQHVHVHFMLPCWYWECTEGRNLNAGNDWLICLLSPWYLDSSSGARSYDFFLRSNFLKVQTILKTIIFSLRVFGSFTSYFLIAHLPFMHLCEQNNQFLISQNLPSISFAHFYAHISIHTNNIYAIEARGQIEERTKKMRW